MAPGALGFQGDHGDSCSEWYWKHFQKLPGILLGLGLGGAVHILGIGFGCLGGWGSLRVRDSGLTNSVCFEGELNANPRASNPE